MGAPRQSYDLFMDLKFKNRKRFTKNLLIFFYLKKDEWNERPLILRDTVLVRFSKTIGCKIFRHQWARFQDLDGSDYHYCINCGKKISDPDLTAQKRNHQLKKLLK